MSVRRVFRDYVVLLAAPKLTMGMLKDMLTPLGFGQVEVTNDDQQALSLIKRIKPGLVVATMSLSVFTGPQILTAIRSDHETQDIPFVIIGVKEDLKPGGIGENISKAGRAAFVGLPVNQEQFTQIVLDLLDPLIDRNKEEAYGLFDRARDLTGAADHEGACQLYEQGLALYQDNLEAWLGYAGAAMETKKYSEAEKAYFRVLGVNQYSFLAYLGLAAMYEQQQEYQLAVGILRQALGIAQRLKVSATAQSRFNFFIGEMELRLKHLGEAEAAFFTAIAQNPNDAQLLSDIGDAYADKDYFAESEQYYEEALEIDPGLAHVFNKLGIAFRRQAKYDRALDLYEKARLHHPHDEHLFFNMARAYIDQNQPTKAVSVLEQALAMAPGFREAKALLAKIKSGVTVVELEDETLEPGRTIISLD